MKVECRAEAACLPNHAGLGQNDSGYEYFVRPPRTLRDRVRQAGGEGDEVGEGEIVICQ